jgi:hypothetical protein
MTAEYNEQQIQERLSGVSKIASLSGDMGAQVFASAGFDAPAAEAAPTGPQNNSNWNMVLGS